MRGRIQDSVTIVTAVDFQIRSTIIDGMPGDYIEQTTFASLDIRGHFFDSLREDYGANTFNEWFSRKSNEPCYVFYSAGALSGFLYLKNEKGPVVDIDPPLALTNLVKIGTFKILAHGTKLGQRFLKKSFDHAVSHGADAIYVTAFPKHEQLIDLFENYGFSKFGTKSGANGNEVVLCKSLRTISGTPRDYYPLIDREAHSQKWLLAIYPEYHTKLFPDSKLFSETYDELQDVSHANSIEKTYICAMPTASQMNSGDKVIMYRTSDQLGRAEYRSVATSVCTLIQRRSKNSFRNEEEFIGQIAPKSVFSKSELSEWWKKRNFYCLDLLYNAALKRRIIRKRLIDEVGIDRHARPSLIELTNDQFFHIMNLGEVNERLIIH